MRKIVEIFIPLEAINPNNAYKARAIKRGNKYIGMMYLDSKTKKYKEEIEKIAKKAMKGKDICYGNIKAVSQWYFGTKRRKDLSNTGKFEYDALNGIVYEDDCQIMIEEKYKIYSKNEPGIRITLYELKDYEDWQ